MAGGPRRGRRAGSGFLIALALVGWAVGLVGPIGATGAATIPAGWKTVRYGNFQIAVPSAWPVEAWRPNCGSPTPVVFLGPEGAQPSCSSHSYGAVVTLGAKPPTGRLATTEIKDGLRVTVWRDVETLTGSVSGKFTRLWVSSSEFVFSVFVGDANFPGGGANRSSEIVDTLTRVGGTSGGGGGGHLG